MSRDIRSGVAYNVSFVGDTLSLTDTMVWNYYCLSPLNTPCQTYKVAITPWSIAPDYTGPSISTMGNVEGG